MDSTSIMLYIIAAISMFIALVLAMYKEKTVAGTSKMWFVIPLFGVAFTIILFNLGVFTSLGLAPGATSGGALTVIQTGNAGGNVPQQTLTTYQPTATYNAIDKFSTTSVSGTSYYKVGSNKATSTAYTNTKIGESAVKYWVDNGTYYVVPEVKTISEVTTHFQATAYENGTFTITGYDKVQKKAITGGEYNSSMGANKDAKEEITVIGSAKTAALPFGGAMVVEFNSSIPTAACSGAQIVGPNNKYQVTYTPSYTTSRYLVYEVANGFDVSEDGGNTGVTRVINCDFTNGATAAGAGSAWYVSFIAANYYLTNDGDIILDTEKAANGATTRTGLSTPTATFYWGA